MLHPIRNRSGTETLANGIGWVTPTFFVAEMLACVAGVLQQLNIYDLHLVLRKCGYKMVTFQMIKKLDNKKGLRFHVRP